MGSGKHELGVDITHEHVISLRAIYSRAAHCTSEDREIELETGQFHWGYSLNGTCRSL